MKKTLLIVICAFVAAACSNNNTQKDASATLDTSGNVEYFKELARTYSIANPRYLAIFDHLDTLYSLAYDTIASGDDIRPLLQRLADTVNHVIETSNDYDITLILRGVSRNLSNLLTTDKRNTLFNFEMWNMVMAYYKWNVMTDSALNTMNITMFRASGEMALRQAVLNLLAYPQQESKAVLVLTNYYDTVIKNCQFRISENDNVLAEFNEINCQIDRSDEKSGILRMIMPLPQVIKALDHDKAQITASYDAKTEHVEMFTMSLFFAEQVEQCPLLNAYRH